MLCRNLFFLCLVHVPGHWVALSPPDGTHTEGAAALLCDSLKAKTFSLSAEEIGEFLALVATFHQRASQEEAHNWSLYLVFKNP